MDWAWVGIAAAGVATLGNIIKSGMAFGRMGSRIDALEDQLKKHEPTAVQIATLSTQMTSLQSSLEKVEHNIDRLFDRTNKRGTA